MKIGEKEIEIKDLADTIKCSRKIIEHVRKMQIDESTSSSKNKSQPQESIKLSDQEKCFRTKLVRVGLFTFCAMGLGKPLCESYDCIKNEEKKMGRRLTDSEVHQIVIDTVKKYGIIHDSYSDSYSDNYSNSLPNSKGG